MNNCESADWGTTERVNGTCIDTQGAYVCECDDGLQWDNDNGGCIGKQTRFADKKTKRLAISRRNNR